MPPGVESIAAGRAPDRPGVRRPRTACRGPDGPPPAVRGQKFPRLISLSMVDVQDWASASELLQLRVLLAQLSQLLGIVGFHAAVLVAPAVPGRLGDLEMTDHLLDRFPFAKELLALGQLPDHLLGRVTPSLHRRAVLLPHMVGLGLAQRVDQLTGTRSRLPPAPATTRKKRCRGAFPRTPHLVSIPNGGRRARDCASRQRPMASTSGIRSRETVRSRSSN